MHIPGYTYWRMRQKLDIWTDVFREMAAVGPCAHRVKSKTRNLGGVEKAARIRNDNMAAELSMDEKLY